MKSKNHNNKKFIKQIAGGAYESKTCDFCNVMMSNHYCLEEDSKSNIVLVGREKSKLPLVCGKCICVLCREKWEKKNGGDYSCICLDCMEKKKKNSKKRISDVMINKDVGEKQKMRATVAKKKAGTNNTKKKAMKNNNSPKKNSLGRINLSRKKVVMK